MNLSYYPSPSSHSAPALALPSAKSFAPRAGSCVGQVVTLRRVFDPPAAISTATSSEAPCPLRYRNVGQVCNLRRVFNPPAGISTATSSEAPCLRLAAMLGGLATRPASGARP